MKWSVCLLPLLVACQGPTPSPAPVEPEVVRAPTPEPAPKAAPKPAERRISSRISVSVEDAPLDEVMYEIGRRTGRNILVDRQIKEKVSVTLRDIPWPDAVRVIARMTDCDVELRPGGILLLTQPPRVTLQFTDANVRTVIQLIAAYSGKNVIISPEVKGNITLDLKDVHWRKALDAVVKTAGDYAVVGESRF